MADALVVIDGDEFPLDEQNPFIFGRVDGDDVVGLDSTDMGISAVAGSVEFSSGLWWVVNESTKRPLLIEHPNVSGHVPLAPGHRHAIMASRILVLVPGAVYTHLIEVVLPAGYLAGRTQGRLRQTSGTVTGVEVTLSERERDALTAICAGYLERFPHRRDRPATYAEAARLLGGDWTADRVRKAVERVKDRFARKQSLYFEGLRSNDELAGHLIATGIVTPDHLSRLPGRAPR